jgi:hypothetical protein
MKRLTVLNTLNMISARHDQDFSLFPHRFRPEIALNAMTLAAGRWITVRVAAISV